MAKKSILSMSEIEKNWGKSPIGITQLMKKTGADYWRMRNKKLKKVT